MYSNASDDDSDGEELLRSARALLADCRSFLPGASATNANLSDSAPGLDSSQAESDVTGSSQASVTVATPDVSAVIVSPASTPTDDLDRSSLTLSADLDRTRTWMGSVIEDLYRDDQSNISENNAARPASPDHDQLEVFENNAVNPPVPRRQAGNRNRRNSRVCVANLRPPDEVIDLCNFAPTIVHATHNTANALFPQPIEIVDLCDSPAEFVGAGLRPAARRRSIAIADSSPTPPIRAPKAKRQLDMAKEKETPVSSADTSVADQPDMTCPVCLEKYSRKHPTFTKCGHLFCQSCIREAVRMYHKCPVCNKKLTNNMLTRAYL